MVRPWCHAPSCSHLHLLPPGIRQRVAQGLPARGATQLALYPLADLRLLETGESEGGRRSESEGPQPTSQHALAPLRRRRGDYVSGRGQGAAESRPRMHVEQEGTARLPGAIVRFIPFMTCAPRSENGEFPAARRARDDELSTDSALEPAAHCGTQLLVHLV